MSQENKQIVGQKFTRVDGACVGDCGNFYVLRRGFDLELPVEVDGILDGQDEDDMGLVGITEAALSQLHHPNFSFYFLQDCCLGDFCVFLVQDQTF